MTLVLCWALEDSLQHSRNACQEGGAALGVEGRSGHRTVPELMHLGSGWH